MSSSMVTVTRALAYLASRNRLFYQISALYYKSIVANEIKLADITEEDHVLCIGGGPCPFTGILFHHLAKARVTVVDNDYGSVLCSRQLVQALGLDRSVKVVFADGNSIEADGYSVVHFALQVCPLEEVFRELERRCRRGTRMLVRLPKRTLKSLYSHGSGEFFNQCEQIVHSRSRNTASTALYIKAGSNYEKSNSICSVNSTAWYSHAAV